MCERGRKSLKEDTENGFVGYVLLDVADYIGLMFRNIADWMRNQR